MEVPGLEDRYSPRNIFRFLEKKIIYKYNNIILGRTSKIGQGQGRILSCGARKPEQT